MKLMLFFKCFFILLALTLIGYGIFSLSLSTVLKAIAFSFGLSVLFSLFYPEVIGIRKGDKVLMTYSDTLPAFFGFGSIGTALENKRRGEYIRVMMEDGREVLGVVKDCGGIISFPKIKMVYEGKEVKR